MMKHRPRFLVTLLFCFSFVVFNTDVINSAIAEQKAVANSLYGKVTDTIDASGYTYAEVDTGKVKVWAAGPVTLLKIGDMIAFPTVMPMKNFHSKSLNRDFEMLYFVNGFTQDKTTVAAPNGQIKPVPAAQAIKVIERAKDGNTIAEINKDKNKFAGKSVRVRGQVTKFTPNIMKMNWLHIKDNSTGDDLTVTTSETVKLNDIVVIEGKLGLNKDFGYGYLYPLIVEDATITKKK
ncbi:MAG: hypothetical protein OQK72_01275 [Gammaproteobacteria bacterium]|nr:hypothetical protein [Gammaproteobacteria bacterium]MCW9003646.1 hypothetical protein [Gammaproteobacteria bacterium]